MAHRECGVFCITCILGIFYYMSFLYKAEAGNVVGRGHPRAFLRPVAGLEQLLPAEDMRPVPVLAQLAATTTTTTPCLPKN